MAPTQSIADLENRLLSQRDEAIKLRVYDFFNAEWPKGVYSTNPEFYIAVCLDVQHWRQDLSDRAARFLSTLVQFASGRLPQTIISKLCAALCTKAPSMAAVDFLKATSSLACLQPTPNQSKQFYNIALKMVNKLPPLLPDCDLMLLFGAVEALLPQQVVDDVDVWFPFLFKGMFHPEEDVRIPARVALEKLLPSVPRELVENNAFVDDVKKNRVDQMKTYIANLYSDIPDVWAVVIALLGKLLHSGCSLINKLLEVEDRAFKSTKKEIRIRALTAWQALVNNFATDAEILKNEKRIKLLMTPLKGSTDSKDILKLHFELWWHLLVTLGTVSTTSLALPFLHFLEHIFGSYKDSTPRVQPPYQLCPLLFRMAADAVAQLLRFTLVETPAALYMSVLRPFRCPVPMSETTFANNCQQIFYVVRECICKLDSSNVDNRAICDSMWIYLLQNINAICKNDPNAKISKPVIQELFQLMEQVSCEEKVASVYFANMSHELLDKIFPAVLHTTSYSDAVCRVPTPLMQMTSFLKPNNVKYYQMSGYLKFFKKLIEVGNSNTQYSVQFNLEVLDCLESAQKSLISLKSTLPMKLWMEIAAAWKAELMKGEMKFRLEEEFRLRERLVCNILKQFVCTLDNKVLRQHCMEIWASFFKVDYSRSMRNTLCEQVCSQLIVHLRNAHTDGYQVSQDSILFILATIVDEVCLETWLGERTTGTEAQDKQSLVAAFSRSFVAATAFMCAGIPGAQEIHAIRLLRKYHLYIKKFPVENITEDIAMEIIPSITKFFNFCHGYTNTVPVWCSIWKNIVSILTQVAGNSPVNFFNKIADLLAMALNFPHGNIKGITVDLCRNKITTESQLDALNPILGNLLPKDEVHLKSKPEVKNMSKAITGAHANKPVRLLTEHQKEKMKRRDDIPALYADLSQDSQLCVTSSNQSSTTNTLETSQPPVINMLPSKKTDYPTASTNTRSPAATGTSPQHWTVVSDVLPAPHTPILRLQRKTSKQNNADEEWSVDRSTGINNSSSVLKCTEAKTSPPTDISKKNSRKPDPAHSENKQLLCGEMQKTSSEKAGNTGEQYSHETPKQLTHGVSLQECTVTLTDAFINLKKDCQTHLEDVVVNTSDADSLKQTFPSFLFSPPFSKGSVMPQKKSLVLKSPNSRGAQMLNLSQAKKNAANEATGSSPTSPASTGERHNPSGQTSPMTPASTGLAPQRLLDKLTPRQQPSPSLPSILKRNVSQLSDDDSVLVPPCKRKRVSFSDPIASVQILFTDEDKVLTRKSASRLHCSSSSEQAHESNTLVELNSAATSTAIGENSKSEAPEKLPSPKCAAGSDSSLEQNCRSKRTAKSAIGEDTTSNHLPVKLRCMITPSGCGDRSNSSLDPTANSPTTSSVGDDGNNSQYSETPTGNVNSDDPIYPTLVNCTVPLTVIEDSLTSPAWSAVLIKQLNSHKLYTIGHISSANVREITKFPFGLPKVETLVNALKKFENDVYIRTTHPPDESCSEQKSVNSNSNSTVLLKKVVSENSETSSKDANVPVMSSEKTSNSSQNSASQEHCSVIATKQPEDTADVILRKLLDKMGPSDTVTLLSKLMKDKNNTETSLCPYLPQGDILRHTEKVELWRELVKFQPPAVVIEELCKSDGSQSVAAVVVDKIPTEELCAALPQAEFNAFLSRVASKEVIQNLIQKVPVQEILTSLPLPVMTTYVLSQKPSTLPLRRLAKIVTENLPVATYIKWMPSEDVQLHVAQSTNINELMALLPKQELLEHVICTNEPGDILTNLPPRAVHEHALKVTSCDTFLSHMNHEDVQKYIKDTTPTEQILNWIPETTVQKHALEKIDEDHLAKIVIEKQTSASILDLLPKNDIISYALEHLKTQNELSKCLAVGLQHAHTAEDLPPDVRSKILHNMWSPSDNRSKMKALLTELGSAVENMSE